MTMKKRDVQRDFQKKCLVVSSDMRVICSRAYHGQGNWTDFLEKITAEIVKFQKLFEDMGGKNESL